MKIILLIALAWVLIAPKISDAQSLISITSTVKWEVNQELCPATGHCGQIIRLSNDGQSLYILMVSSRQLYVIDGTNQITQYDLSSLPGISATDFDYIPYDQTTLLVLDTLSDTLYKYDLLSHQITKIASSYRFVSCNNTTANPPFHSFTRFGERDLLATCGRGSSSGDTYNLSIVNVTTETVQEIAALEGREGRPRSWRRITAGRDGFVYLQPGISDLLTTIVPDFQTQSIDYLLLLKRGIESEDWLPLQIPYQSLIESGVTAAQLELLAVDAESNLYFMNWGSPDLIQYIKFNPQGDIEWAVNQGEFGSDISFLDVTPAGELIMLDAGSADNQSTIGDQVAQYAIESELDTPSAISEAPIARLESQLNWQISAVDCSIVYCHKRLSPQGVLYIFQDYPVRKLYVLQPDGTPPIEHDLTSAGQLIMGRIDFVPFDDLQAVIFFADAGDPITLARYELATGQISDFSLPLVNRISLCNRSSWFLSTLPYAISQIGLDDQLLVCTYSTDSGAQINVVDVSNQTVLQSINLGTQATGGRFDPPWGSLIGGADGNIYLESSFPPPTLYDQFPELQTLDVSSSGFLFRFSLPDNQWRFQVRSAAAENLYPLRYVDAKGNLYTVAERPLMLYEHSFVLTRLDHQFRLLSRIPQGTFDPNTRFLGATLNGDVVLVHEEELIVRQISEFDLFPMVTATP